MVRKTTRHEPHAELGRKLRDLVLSVYCQDNPYHDNPGWSEITDFSRYTWTLVAQALITAGWRPPLDT